MVVLDNYDKCVGCSTCENICPANAVKMEYNEKGFYVPVIDDNKCIKCNKCVDHCPMCAKIQKNKIVEAFVYQNDNRDILSQSTSGGAFTAIAEQILAKGGCVYGAAYDEKWRVIHRRVDTTRELSLLRGSKYVQSLASQVFVDVKKNLEMGKMVLFCGCPCQIAGLKSYLEKDYQKLLTIDLVCHGGASPELWDRNISYLLSHYKKNISSISFRDKVLGYAGSTMSVCFDEKKIVCGKRIQAFKVLFFAGYNVRVSCFECKFKGKSRLGDITLFDCWHSRKFDKRFNNDLGATAILANSAHGIRELHKAMKPGCYKKVEIEKLIALDGDMLSGYAIKPKNYSIFWERFSQGNNPIELLDEFRPYTLKKTITEWTKPLLFRLGILDRLKHLIYSRKY